MYSPKRILITGATGTIGRKLRKHLSASDRYELTLVARGVRGDPRVMDADLRNYHPSWTGLFKGVDAVVHLANVPAHWTRWDAANCANIDMSLNVYNAAAEHGVKRVVFASSVWTMYGYRFNSTVRTPDMPANPGVSPYGMTKIIAERIGKAFCERYGISTVVLRIGSCRGGNNVPEPDMPTGDWEQDCWISDRDLCNGIEQAIHADDISYAVLNLTSNNSRARWSSR